MAVRADQIFRTHDDWDDQYIRAAEAFIDGKLKPESRKAVRVQFHQLQKAAGRYEYPDDHVIAELLSKYQLAGWIVSMARDQWFDFSLPLQAK